MDLAPETDDYIRESIENSLGLPVSAKTLHLKLMASEDERRRLQDKIFVFQGLLSDADRRLEQCRAEANMNAQGLRRCIEEKEATASEYGNLANHCAELEKECALYERDMARLMESCDELAKENDELRLRLKETSVTALISEVETLKKDKEYLRVNLSRAEEEVKVLFEENTVLDEENKKLLKLLNRERHNQGSGGKLSASASSKPDISNSFGDFGGSKFVHMDVSRFTFEENNVLDEENKKLLKLLNRERHNQGSGGKLSASASSKGKRKSSSIERGSVEKAISFQSADLPRQPLSPLQQNSPDSRIHKI